MPAYRRLRFDQDLWDRLKATHAAVRGRFVWVADEDNFGTREHWDRPTPGQGGYLRGDCDDFTIECDFEARGRGIPPDAMTYYRCTAETGVGHLVLGVHTDAGVVILDNRQRLPILADQLDRAGYANWARPKPGRPMNEPWETVSFTPRQA